MNSFPNAEVPISYEDRAEILAIFIALMSEQDASMFGGTESSKPSLSDPPSGLSDLRSQWGLQ